MNRRPWLPVGFALGFIVTFAFLVWIAQAEWGFGSRVVSPDGNYVAEMITHEKLFVGDSRWATYSVTSVKAGRVVFDRTVELREGYLVCDQPGKVKWADDSSTANFTAMYSGAGRWLQFKVNTDGTVRERWVDAGQPPSSDW